MSKITREEAIVRIHNIICDNEGIEINLYDSRDLMIEIFDYFETKEGNDIPESTKTISELTDKINSMQSIFDSLGATIKEATKEGNSNIEYCKQVKHYV